MKLASAKKLQVGDRVRWIDGTLGTVRETGYAAIKIEWDDHKWALLPFANIPKQVWEQIEVVA